MWWSKPRDPEEPMPFGLAWSLACGQCDHKRGYWYTFDEVMDELHASDA
jgi:hypothetical protein